MHRLDIYGVLYLTSCWYADVQVLHIYIANMPDFHVSIRIASRTYVNINHVISHCHIRCCIFCRVVEYPCDCAWVPTLYGDIHCMAYIETLINTLYGDRYDFSTTTSDTVFRARNGNHFCSCPYCYVFLANFG